jgi:hypothetical protein
LIDSHCESAVSELSSVKSSFCAGPEPVTAAHGLAYQLLQRRLLGRVLALHHHAVEPVPRLGHASHRRGDRGEHLQVEREAEHLALLLQHADDAERDAAELDLAADRVHPREVQLRHLAADHDHRRARGRLLLAEHPATLDGEVLDGEQAGGHRLDDHLRAALAVRGDRRLPGDVLDGPAGAHGERVAHGVGVLQHDLRAALELPPLGLAHLAVEVRRLAQVERVDAEELAGEVALDVLRHPVDDAHDGDEEHDADGHAEQGEEALELLHADLAEGEADRFEGGHGRACGGGGWHGGGSRGARGPAGAVSAAG